MNHMDRALETMVRERAGGCCEYCRAPEELSSMPFQLDHIIAEQHGGPTAASNLALTVSPATTIEVRIWAALIHKQGIGGGGVSLHWPDLDEDLSISGLMAGFDRRSG